MNKATTVNIPLQEIAGDVEFYRGTRFRRYGVGLNGVAEKDDYYEYMLVDTDTTSYMLFVNVSSESGSHKAGHVSCYVQKLVDVNRAVVTAEAIKYSVGKEHMYLMQEV